MSTPAGVGKNLRGHAVVSLSVENQIKVVGELFDPVEEPCAIVEVFGTWCPPCRAYIPTLMKHTLEFKNIKFLQVSNDDPKKLQDFYKGVKVPFVVSHLPAQVYEDFSNFFSIRGIPHVVILRNGVAAYSGHPMTEEFEKMLKKFNTEIENEKKEAKELAEKNE